MTNRSGPFASPFLLGFDQLEQALDRVSKSSDGYPPYNIEKLDDARLRITLAVAGFSMDQLDVSVDGDQLIVRGKQVDEGGRVFLHRGIAARQFQRAFVLADGLEVAGADLADGLLHIELKRVPPRPASRQIAITRRG